MSKRPMPADDEVLVRIHAAVANPMDDHQLQSFEWSGGEVRLGICELSRRVSLLVGQDLDGEHEAGSTEIVNSAR